MTDLPPSPHSNRDTGDDTGARVGRGSPKSRPRWVNVFGVTAIILVLLFVILHLASGGMGNHTP